MVTLPFWSIVTPAQVFEAALESFGRKAFAAASDDLYPGAVQVCRAVTNTVEAALNRKLIVRPYVEWFDDRAWCYDTRYYRRSDDYAKRIARSDGYPIVEVTSANGSTDDLSEIEIIAPDRFLVSDEVFEEPIESMGYFAGYRRSDQTVTGADTDGALFDCGSGSGDTPCQDLAGEEGLEGLTVLPPLLPDDIARVALRLAIFEMRVELRGLPGFDRTVKNIEGVSIEVERPDRDFVERELAKIKGTHRNPPSAR